MAHWPWRRRRGATEDCSSEVLVAEVTAFLSGAALSVLPSRPSWAWAHLNWLCHADPLEVVAGPPGDSAATWRWATDVMRGEVLARAGGDLGRIADLQHDCLIPLELLLLCPASRGISPASTMSLVLSTLSEYARSHHPGEHS